MLRLLLLLTLVSPLFVSAQSGPAGVGNTNGRSPLFLWLEADRLAGNDGDTVAVWPDGSGRGNDFGEGTGAVLRRDAVNGHAALHFDGTQYFERAFGADMNPPTFTMFFVTRVEASDTYKTVISSRDDDGMSRTGYMLYAKPHSDDWSFWTAKATSDWQRLTGEGLINTWSGQTIHFQGGTDGKEMQVATVPTIKSSSPYVPNVKRPIRIGAGLNEAAKPDFYFTGDMAEIIVYGQYLNRTQRLITSNYLAAKYGYALPAHEDAYQMDELLSGDYDHDVAGIGRFNAFDMHVHARGTGIVRMLGPDGLDDNEFLLWGHDGGALSAGTHNEVPPGLVSRLDRVWRVSETDASGKHCVDVGTLHLSFDLTDLVGTGEISPEDVVLLVDTNGDGFFDDETPIGDARCRRNTVYIFSGVTQLRNGSRFTVGFRNAEPTGNAAELYSNNK